MSDFDKTVIQSTRDPAFAAPETGLKKLGRYELERVLGRGGMGLVYLARDPQLDRHVAVKVLTAGALAAPELKARFHKEARAIGHVQHPNIADVFEVGEDDGQPFLVMEYLPNGSLADRISTELPAAKQACLYVETLARAVHAAHQNGVVHRDLKPSNVLFARDDTLKVTDFGLAKRLDADDHATATGEILGTPSYMAPEQAGGVVKNVGAACDVYALGAILYELLTGRPPFHSPDPIQTVLMVLSAEPVSVLRLQPNLPRDLATICHKCLEKSPARRYPSAAALADDLARFSRGEPILARPVRVWERAAKWARRRPALALLAGIIVLFVLTVLVGSSWHNLRLQAELNRSDRLFTEGRDLARWVLYDHVDSISRLQGGTTAQESLMVELRKYLDGLAANVGNDMALATELAAAYERIGEVQGDPNHFNLGQTDAALESYRQALAIRNRIVAERPGEFAAHWNYTAVLGRVASVLAAMGQFETAASHYQQAIDRLIQIRQQFPHRWETPFGLSRMHSGLGDLQQERGRLDEALASQRKALQLVDESLADAADAIAVRRHQALLHSRIGGLLELQGDLEGARKHYEFLLQTADEGVTADPHDAQRLRDLSLALIALGDLASRSGDHEQALASYERVLEMRRRHRDADPRSATVAGDMAVALERIGTMHHLLKNYKTAIEHFREHLQITLKLADDDPGNRPLHRDVWIAHDKLGGSLLLAGDLKGAEEQFKFALTKAQTLVDTDPQSVADLQGVAQAYDNLGNLEVQRLSPATTAEQTREAFQNALASYGKSLETFDRMESITALNAQQENLRAGVRKKIELVKASMARLEAEDL